MRKNNDQTMFEILEMDVMNKLPVLFEGFEAMCEHIAVGDIDGAYSLGMSLHKNSRVLKQQVLVYMDHRDKTERGRLNRLRTRDRGLPSSTTTSTTSKY
jgi:hypothetical protein